MSSFRNTETSNTSTERLTVELSRIYEQALEEMLALLHSRQPEPTATPDREWMNATQLAEYWQLYNDKNEPTTAGILKWARRPKDQFLYLMRTWETCSDSIVTRLIDGRTKKLKGDGCRTKNDA